MRGKRLISCLLGLALCGTAFAATAIRAQAKVEEIVDDFAGYAYDSVDSARYTLYGQGKFASNAGVMKIDYGTTEDEHNGVFVNLGDMVDPGESIRVSFKYGNGNYNTKVEAKASLYYDETAGDIIGQTPPVAGSGNIAADGVVSALKMTVPDYQSSVYLYIQSKAKVIYLDDLKIEKYNPDAYEAVGAEVVRLEQSAYEGMGLDEIFSDSCSTYGTVANIPADRYQPRPASAYFLDDSGRMVVMEDGKEAHGPYMNIKDIAAEQGWKAGDSFYLSFTYGCENWGTPSTVAAHLMVNGADAASFVLQTDICGSGIGKNATVYAKITLPENLPTGTGLEELGLYFEATSVDKAYFTNIKVSTKAPFTAEGASVERMDESAYQAAAKQNLLSDSCSTYSDVSTIPARYWVNPESAENLGFASDTVNGFASTNGWLFPKYAGSAPTGHGLCVDILDIVRGNGLGEGDTLYLSYDYMNYNGMTQGTTIAHLMADGVDAASQVLAEGILSSTSPKSAYAKIILPTNLPASVESLYLFLEGTSVDRAGYRNLVLSRTRPSPENAVLVTEPILNEAGDKAVMNVTNTTGAQVTLNVAVATGSAGSIETSIEVLAGTVEQKFEFAAKEDDVVTITDKGNPSTVYVDSLTLRPVRWVGTWGTALMSITGATDLPTAGFDGNTLRQFVRISSGGSKLRLKLSNEYGSTPLVLNAVQIAKAEEAMGSSAINSGSQMTVTFDGNAYVSIAPGEVAVSDMIYFDAADREKIAITMSINTSPSTVTGHTGSRTDSFIGKNYAVDGLEMTGAEKVERWYYIAGIDALKERNYGAIVCLGDSITDGRGVTHNADNRWTDILAERLKTDEKTNKLSVLNMGIGGNSIFSWGLGPNAIDRFDRDVLQQEGVEYLIVFGGINNIHSSKWDETNRDECVASLTSAYADFIEKAHAKGIKVYGGTITPFGGCENYNDNTRYIRDKVNEWIKATHFDGYIDFASVVAKPDDAEYIFESYQDDNLHPTAELYKKMGDSIDLSLFKDNAAR